MTFQTHFVVICIFVFRTLVCISHLPPTQSTEHSFEKKILQLFQLLPPVPLSHLTSLSGGEIRELCDGRRGHYGPIMLTIAKKNIQSSVSSKEIREPVKNVLADFVR